ncbi:putative Protein kinase domain containing protein [Blattamonas nauphoetae]|uniref:Protein kinase domain-containing protein n=1 Tax=Blattamonas nauphoetae TaxID=2049346 RepID=A0ABQ9X4T1_9EUKA|nr:putative Protein kinase domain containing protein [Blattamonas nauphoetae]
MSNPVKVPDGYTFVKPINSGGFGSVVELMENSTQEHYAGKLMQCVTEKDEERIDREVNRLDKFECDWIVGLKEIVLMDNSKVIVMELGGQSLADIVKDHTSRGVLVPRDVVYRVMVDVSCALNLMHNHESGATAHGDVKMENILLFPGGHFKLCDLGAAESEDVSSTRSVMSQLYVSPERMESETGKATCSSDVWSLGIVLHWLLFGEPPFKSQNAARLFREIGSFQVSMIDSSCGGEERALLMRMLDPNPETRVTSSQLCSFGVFRCLVNTPSGVWKLKDADDQENSNKLKNVTRLEAELVLTRERDNEALSKEQEEHKKTQELLYEEEQAHQAEKIKVQSLEEELSAAREALMKEQEEHKKTQELLREQSQARQSDAIQMKSLEKELSAVQEALLEEQEEHIRTHQLLHEKTQTPQPNTIQAPLLEENLLSSQKAVLKEPEQRLRPQVLPEQAQAHQTNAIQAPSSERTLPVRKEEIGRVKEATEKQLDVSSSISTSQSAIPSILFADPSHFHMDGRTLTRTALGRDKKDRSLQSSLFLSKLFENGVISVEVMILSLKYGTGDVYFGLLDSTSPLPNIGESIGYDVANSVSINRYGRLYCYSPSFRSLENCCPGPKDGDCIRMEVDLDSTPRTVQFFLNGRAGYCFVSGIPSSVRIGFSVGATGTSFRIDRISRLSKRAPIMDDVKELKW